MESGVLRSVPLLDKDSASFPKTSRNILRIVGYSISPRRAISESHKIDEDIGRTGSRLNGKHQFDGLARFEGISPGEEIVVGRRLPFALDRYHVSRNWLVRDVLNRDPKSSVFYRLSQSDGVVVGSG